MSPVDRVGLRMKNCCMKRKESLEGSTALQEQTRRLISGAVIRCYTQLVGGQDTRCGGDKVSEVWPGMRHGDAGERSPPKAGT